MSIKEEWNHILTKMENHHSIFYKIIQMGKPVFTDKIQTAAVQFDKEGNYLMFLFNENFWNECDEYKKIFVICHEALHIILNHGKRFQEKENPKIFNIAVDIVVNHSLVKDFGFIREEIDAKNEYCWIDTIFGEKKHNGLDYPDDETSEFYYNEIKKDPENNGGSGSSGKSNGNQKLVDEHQALSEEEIKEIMEKVGGELTDDEKTEIDNIISSKMAGNGSGFWASLGTRKVIKNKKWESVIRKWKMKVLKITDVDKEQWSRKSRRMNAYYSDMILPSEAEIEDYDKETKKIDVFFFLDTSGSCYGLKDRFFTAAASLPEDRFNVRLFCFDTKAEETTLESRRVYGGGGTSFACIEEKIRVETEGKKYPSAVFVITDGMGSKVNPIHPERWYWFLSEDNKKYIPIKSNVYNLDDYV